MSHFHIFIPKCEGLSVEDGPLAVMIIQMRLHIISLKSQTEITKLKMKRGTRPSSTP
jgi:hypothetical protein